MAERNRARVSAFARALLIVLLLTSSRATDVDVSCPGDDTSASVCGNGVLEPGETCDVVGAACCVNCQFVEPAFDTQVSASDALICRLRTSTVGLSVPLKKSTEYLFRYDQQASAKEPLPVYSQPKLDGSGIKIAWTDNSVEGIYDADRIHITDLDRQSDGSYTVSNDLVISGREVRGLYTHFSGWTAVLVRTSIDAGYPGTPRPDSGYGAFVQNMEIRRYRDSDGALEWSTALEDDPANEDIGRIHDFGICDSRLAYGGGQLGMYYKVSTGQLDNWHEGDTFKKADTATGEASTTVGWGCSHSMGISLTFNAATNSFGRACVTDAFPLPMGLYYNNGESSKTLIKQIDANMAGLTDGGVGEIVSDGGDGFIIVFTAPKDDPSITDDNTYTSELATRGGPGSDVGIVRVAKNGGAGEVTWLTSTDGVDEIGAHVTEYGPDELLVSWRAGDWKEGGLSGVCGADGVRYFVAILRRSDFAVVKGPEEVTKLAPFTERDAWFTFSNGDAGWVAPGGSDKQAVVKYVAELDELQVTTMRLPPQGHCGNGMLDSWAGETCDVDNACCVECQVVAGAQCTEGECCDLDTCLFKPVTVTCALDRDESFDVSSCDADVANCGSCLNGACSLIPGQYHSNTGWCPSQEGSCTTRIAYDFGGGPVCINNFYSEKTLPQGTVCGNTVDGQRLCNITAPDTAVCADPAPPVPKLSSLPPCPSCGVAAGSPCSLSTSWPELDALELGGATVLTGGLGPLMDDEYRVWVCTEMACAADDMACFKYHEALERFDWWGFNSRLRVV